MPHTPPTNTTSNTVVNSDLIILLAAPSYDKLTEYTSSLVVNLPPLGGPTRLRVIKSELTYDQLLAQEGIDPADTEVSLVFCGHGEDASLRGPGPDDDDEDSPFYDDSHHSVCPKLMLAFCCLAAKGIGRSYEDKTAGQTFIGFDDDIGFVMEGGPYADWWTRIIHDIARAMLSGSDANEIQRASQKIYKDALHAFRSEKDAENDWGLLMRSYLRHQYQALNIIQT